MNPKLRELEEHLRAQYQQLVALEDAYDAAAAHELYADLRQAGFSKVTVLQSSDSIWVDEAEKSDQQGPRSGELRKIHMAEANEVFMEWTDNYSLSAAQRLLREEGGTFDLSQDPIGVSREEAQARVERALPESATTTTVGSRDSVIEGATISHAFTAAGGIPEEEITDASTKSQMVIGIGPPNQEDVHPYILESEPTEQRPDQTQLWAHAPGAAGEARLVDSYNTYEANALVENVSFDIRADIDRMDQHQKLVQQQTAVEQLASTSTHGSSMTPS